MNQIAFSGGQPRLMASACSSSSAFSVREHNKRNACSILDYTVLLWDAEAALCLANYVGPDQHKQGVLAVVRVLSRVITRFHSNSF